MATEPNPEQGKLAPGTEKTIRLVRPSLVVLCGPAACGKSTFAVRHFRATQIISSDWARGRVCDDERDQRYQTQAFALVHFLIEQRLSLNRLCVVDSTALTLQARNDLLELARKYQVPCIALLFDIPLEKCLERDQARERTVGRPVIERQYQLFQQAKAAIRQEGFEQVVDLRDEDLDKARIEIVFRPVARPATGPTRPGPGTWRRPVSRRGGPGLGSPPARFDSPHRPERVEGEAGPRTQAPARPAPYQPPDAAPSSRTGGPERLGTGREGVEAGAAPQASQPAQASARPPIPGPQQPVQAVPAGPPQPAPAAAPKPDVSAPGGGPASPSGGEGPGGPPLPPGTPSDTPPEQGKT